MGFESSPATDLFIIHACQSSCWAISGQLKGVGFVVFGFFSFYCVGSRGRLHGEPSYSWKILLTLRGLFLLPSLHTRIQCFPEGIKQGTFRLGGWWGTIRLLLWFFLAQLPLRNILRGSSPAALFLKALVRSNSPTWQHCLLFPSSFSGPSGLVH